MNAVFIIPTGIGAAIGGHAGDATPAARLISSVCDNLIIHPNVVNASDINEMTDNMLYVEGSMLDRFLEGEITLKKVKGNKILVAVNSPIRNEIINAVSAARATLGINAEELGVTIKQVVNQRLSNSAIYAICLYDTNSGGSGFASLAGQQEIFKSMLEHALHLLECPNCQNACQNCLLQFES